MSTPKLNPEHDNVVPIRPAAPSTAIETKVFEGELVTDDPGDTAPGSDVPVPGTQLVVRPARSATVVVKPVARAAVVAGGRVAVVGGRIAARTAVTLWQGHASWGKRALQAATLGTVREQVRVAQVAGDREALAEWTDRLTALKTARSERLRALPATVVAVVRAVALLVAVLAVFAVVIGAACQFVPGGQDWAGWWELIVDIGDVTIGMITVAVIAVLIGFVPAVLFAAYREGTRHGEVPVWLRPADQRNTDAEPITPSVVVTALRDLGIGALRTAIKAMGDGGSAMLGPIRIAGCGVEVDVLLPSGVMTEDVQKRRRKLAENMHRHEHEVFITIPVAARTVRLWIADSGALDEPIGPSPLVIDPDMTADLYTGRAPWGQDLRGDVVALALLQRHFLITGLSNQGKTAALRALALWLALDLFVEFHIADLKGVGDWRMFDGLAKTLIQGPTDEHVIAATEMLEWGVAEMERRIEALEASGATDGVTRDMARGKQGFHPITLLVDEAQVAFMCPAIGDDKRPYGGSKSTSRYFMAARKIQNQGRAVNVVLWQGTQNPTDQNLPKLVREGAHIRASLVLGSEAESRMALGDKAVNGGAAPHKLRTGADKGTLVVAGDGVPMPSGQAALTIRTHYIDGVASTDIAERAKTLRGQQDTATDIETTVPLDHLTDIAAALGGAQRMRTQEVLQRLAEANRAVYSGWTFTNLHDALPESAKPYKTGGWIQVSAARVHEAITERDENGEEAEGGN